MTADFLLGLFVGLLLAWGGPKLWTRIRTQTASFAEKYRKNEKK